VVPDTRPVVVIEYGTDPNPDPRSVPLAAGTRMPKVSLHVTGLVVLYRNQPVVASPFGTPVPLSTADVVVRPLAAFVVTVGADANAARAPPRTNTNPTARNMDLVTRPLPKTKVPAV
jgi:hypothetical protein